MAFTFGFYNALNHDRRYNAIQVSSIFDGIIKDGIFMSIGGHMNVKATGNGFNIVVESGRAWFNHTWSLLDADYPMVVSPSDVLEDRIDVVVLEVNENVDVRQNFIKIIAGTPAKHPTKPALTNNLDIHQYALAYITVPANSVTLTQSNVENAVGLGSTPFVTGILETINIDDLIAQWESQWSDWTEEVDLNWNNWFDTVDNAWTTWFTQQQSKWEDILTERTEEWEDIKDTVDSEWATQQGSINSDYTNWKSSALASYNQWLDQIKGTLDDDAATQLAKEVVELKNRDDVISTYQHVKSGTEHVFIGSGSNGKVKMTADIASGDKVVISSAPKEKVTVEGATSQPGSGDPSPNNIRMIDGIGMYDKMLVLDGSEDESWYQEGNGVCILLGIRGITIDYVTKNNNTAICDARCNSFRAGSVNDTYYGRVEWTFTFPIKPEQHGRIFFYNGRGDLSDFKSYRSAHPLIVWYRAVDFFKAKGPFYYVHEVSDGTETPYKAIAIELNAPLFDGDSLEIGGLSGFDKMVVVDGSKDFKTMTTVSGGKRIALTAYIPAENIQAVASTAVVGAIASSQYPARSAKDTYASVVGISVEADGTVSVYDPDIQTDETAKAYFQSHPLTVFYKSVNYTPESDIAVALEKRASHYQMFDGTEDFVNAYTFDDAYEYQTIVSGIGDISNPTSDGRSKSSHYVASSLARTGHWSAYPEDNDVVYQFFYNKEDCPDVVTLKEILQNEASKGTPVQTIVYAESVRTYAHLIQTEALPAYYGTEDFVTALAGEKAAGKWLTFTNDGAQLNFKGGGGVGVSKLAATTAVPADVVQGRTFYSKDKTLKTGALADKPALNDAVSVGNDGSYLYARIPVGAYRAKQATGYPEIRFPNSDAIENIPGGDNGAWSGTYSGSNVTIPKGYHNGNGSVGVAGGNRGNWNGTYSGSDVAIPKGYHAGGGKVSVSGGNKGAWGSTINPGGSVTIPKGYHNGSGVVKANGNSINFHPIDRTVGWGSGVRFTGEDATPGASGKMRFVLKYWCRTEYNVNGYIKVLRNGIEIHSTTFNKHYDSPYNDDVPNGYINVEFSGSGTYQIQVSVDYNAGEGEIKMGGAFIGY